MSDWQSESVPQEPPSIRSRWAVNLVEALEQLEEKFIMGTIDRETFNAELSELDSKLAIIGLGLVSKPWKSPRV